MMLVIMLTQRFTLYFNRATPSAFPVLGVELLAGRMYANLEEGKLVVSASAARAIAADVRSAVGRHLVRINELDDREDETYEIIGVVADVHYDDVRSAAELVGYLPVEEVTPNASLVAAEQGMSLLQVHGEGQASTAAWVQQLAQADRVSDLLRRQSRTELLLSRATMGYAAVALALMLLGLLAQARTELTQQARSFALRVVVGARLGQVTREFITRPLLLAVSAVAPLLAMLAATTKVWLPRLPLLRAGDVMIVAGVVVVVVVVFSACLAWLARRRLGAVDLANLLRVER